MKSPHAVALGKLRWEGKTKEQKSAHGKKAVSARTPESYKVSTAKRLITLAINKKNKYRTVAANKIKDKIIPKIKKSKHKSEFHGREVSLFTRQPNQEWKLLGKSIINLNGTLGIIPKMATQEQVDLANMWIKSGMMAGSKVKDGIGFRMEIENAKT